MDSSIKSVAAARSPDMEPLYGAAVADEPAVATSARKEPTLGEPAPKAKIEPSPELDIETIQSVIALTRRVATQNYEAHLEAARQAKSPEELEAAIAAAARAFEASNNMRAAQNYFNSAEGDVQLGSLLFMQGKDKEAEKKFTSAGDHIRTAADKVDDFSKYVMQSRFMERAIAVVAKADDVKNLAVERVTGAYVGFEQSAVRTAEGFSRGLKSFSERMVEFGHKVAAAPKQIRDLAREKSVSMVEATATVVTGFLSRMKKAAQSVSNAVKQKVDAVDAKVEALDRRVDAKLEAIDARVTAGIDRVKEEAHHAWDTLEQHAQAAMKASRDLAERTKAGGQEAVLNGRAVVDTAVNIGRNLRAVLASEFVASKTKLKNAANTPKA
jgi:tetratricopeptide (TPR) repeat protein